VFEKDVEYRNAVLNKSFRYSVLIVKLYDYHINKRRSVEPLIKQLLRSGTSIGANIAEAQSAYTKKDCEELIKILTAIIKSSRNNI
jgi:hypothetical protein